MKKKIQIHPSTHTLKLGRRKIYFDRKRNSFRLVKALLESEGYSQNKDGLLQEIYQMAKPNTYSMRFKNYRSRSLTKLISRTRKFLKEETNPKHAKNPIRFCRKSKKYYIDL